MFQFFSSLTTLQKKQKKTKCFPLISSLFFSWIIPCLPLLYLWSSFSYIGCTIFLSSSCFLGWERGISLSLKSICLSLLPSHFPLPCHLEGRSCSRALRVGIRLPEVTVMSEIFLHLKRGRKSPCMANISALRRRGVWKIYWITWVLVTSLHLQAQRNLKGETIDTHTPLNKGGIFISDWIPKALSST